jgi:hypothetical protein
MNMKNFLIIVLSVLLGAAPVFAARTAGNAGFNGLTALNAADKELDQFLKAKEAVFQRDWPLARKQLNKFLEDFPGGRLQDEALYWLAKSLDGCAARESSPESVIGLKKEAFETLERLGREHPSSAWKTDAEEMRIEIAGELVLLGVVEYQGFISEYATSRNTDESGLKLAALNSLIRLKPETALAVLSSTLERDADPRMRKRCATLLGQNYAREALPVLEQASRSDRDAGVREEAAYWSEQIGVRLIPADLSYYAFEAHVTGEAARSRLKEGVLNRFTTARKSVTFLRPASHIISSFFDGQVGKFGSSAVFQHVANDYIRGRQTSHRLHDFRVSIVPESLRKSSGRVEGEIEFTDLVSGGRYSDAFRVDGRNDQIFAARHGDKAAVMLLQFEATAGGAAPETEVEGEEELTGLLGFLSKIFGGSSERKPVYYNLYANFMGCRVHSSLQTTLSGKNDVWDFSLAKAEIPAKDRSQGIWTLEGHITAFVKNRTFIARRASLKDPSGKVVAVAEEITVPANDPAAFRVQGSRLVDKKAVEQAAAAEPSAPTTGPKAEPREQICELKNGVKVFFTARNRIAPEELQRSLVEFGQARVEIPGRDGTWILTGIVRWISAGGLLLGDKATLTDPRGNVRARDASLLVPMKNPDKYYEMNR